MHNRVTSDDLSDRIDAEYYSKEFMNNEAKFWQFKNYELQELVDKTKKYNIADFTSNGAFAELAKVEFSSEEGMPFLRTQNLRDNYVITDDLIFVKFKSIDKLQKSICREGDLLLARTGSVGCAVNVPKELDKSNINQNITRFILDRNIINPYYCSVFFNSFHGRLRFSREATGIIQK